MRATGFPDREAVADAGNSSAAALSASATFAGEWFQTNLPEMLVVCDTDTNGADIHVRFSLNVYENQ